MLLVCSTKCGGALFRALVAEVDIDSSGEYADHRVVQDVYVCLNCGSPAIDLGRVGDEIAEEEAAGAPFEAREVLCPVCETLIDVGPELECPMCGAYLEGLETTR